MRPTTFAAIIALCIVGSGRPSAAQTETVERDCDKAAKIIEKGHPEKKEEWAYNYITRCGAEGARAVSAGMLTLRQQRDTSVLDAFMWQADNWRDATVMEAATQVATDVGASPEARVFAVRHLIGLLRPQIKFTYGHLTASSDSTQANGVVVYEMGCRAALGSEGADVSATALPTDYVARIRSTLRGLRSDPATPTPVRNAAACALTDS
jgi:hypothetical protein